MGKVTRYFDAKSEDPVKSESSERKTKVRTYEVQVKHKKWGRKHADLKQAAKPNKFEVKLAKEVLEKHSRGEGIDKTRIKTITHQKKFEEREKKIEFANQQAALAEVLLPEDGGYLEADEGETTTQFTQKQLAKSVDITTAAKAFDLDLQFGGYRAKYTRNGRHLLLGGRKGHVAAFDWVTKKLHCEINVMESVQDIQWFHIETMFAVAQKEWVYIYDNQGIELHCLKKLNRVNRMEFLPYHFLLVTANEEGYLKWLDISMGEIVAEWNTHLGRLTMMTQNPYNAIVCLGHSKGVVSMWAPNSKRPLAKMLCHSAPMTALTIDPKGMYLATAGIDKTVKIWDIRTLDGPLQTYKLRSTAHTLTYSQKGMLAVGMGNLVEVFKDCNRNTAKRAYMRHRFNTPIGNMNFCPFEDFLGVATERGFSSLLIPGSGEPNFDAFEVNPYQTKSQRREAEVKALLEKIQPELISLNPTAVTEVDVPTLKEKIEAKQKLLFVKAPKLNLEPRRKMKGRGGSVMMAKKRKIMQEEAKKEFRRKMEAVKKSTKEQKSKATKSVLDRFLPKK